MPVLSHEEFDMFSSRKDTDAYTNDIVAGDLPHTAEAPEALPLVAVGFSLHPAWQSTLASSQPG
jgi:hypothetical protein